MGAKICQRVRQIFSFVNKQEIDQSSSGCHDYSRSRQKNYAELTSNVLQSVDKTIIAAEQRH